MEKSNKRHKMKMITKQKKSSCHSFILFLLKPLSVQKYNTSEAVTFQNDQFVISLYRRMTKYLFKFLFAQLKTLIPVSVTTERKRKREKRSQAKVIHTRITFSLRRKHIFSVESLELLNKTMTPRTDHRLLKMCSMCFKSILCQFLFRGYFQDKHINQKPV
ncbi:hypothetical protein NL108_012540 [Boleophthalmus pectinirostris]|nr:hypothetical protein NL108_012540 [Boleophthalmus pectinirostris]